MTRIEYPDDFDIRTAAFVEKVIIAVRAVLTEAAGNLSTYPNANDLSNIYSLWQRRVDDELISDLDAAYRYGTDMVNAQLPQDDNALVASLSISAYLANARERLLEIGATAWENARTALLNGINESERIKALRDRVTGSVGPTTRFATEVSRSEYMHMVNAGALDRMREIGLAATKEWSATFHNTRPTHAEAHGQVVDLNEKFFVGGHYLDRPHDEGAPPEETANCHCRMFFEVTEVESSMTAAAVMMASADVQTDAMIALIPSAADLDRLVLDGGEARDQLHLTLYYLGNAADLGEETYKGLVTAITSMMEHRDVPPAKGIAFGVNFWNPAGDEPCWVLAVGDVSSDGSTPEVEKLGWYRECVQEAWFDGGVTFTLPPQYTPWAPHIAEVYSADPAVLPALVDRLGPVTFDRIRVAFAGEVSDIVLNGTSGNLSVRAASLVEDQMPWHKVHNHSKCPSSKPWAVVKDSDGKVVGCHENEAKANKQLAALHASEKAAAEVGCVDCTDDAEHFGSSNSVSDEPWNGAASNFTDAQYKMSSAGCDPGGGPPKSACFLPHHNPGGALNRSGLAAAAGRVSGLSGRDAGAVARAKAHLRGHYKALGEDVPDSIAATTMYPVPQESSTEVAVTDLLAVVDLGGKPTEGTKADKRLKENKNGKNVSEDGTEDLAPEAAVEELTPDGLFDCPPGMAKDPASGKCVPEDELPGAPESKDDKKAAVEPGLSWKKGFVYSDTVEYETNDVVAYQGTTYVVAENPPVGTRPTDEAYWSKLMLKDPELEMAAKKDGQNIQEDSVMPVEVADEPVTTAPWTGVLAVEGVTTGDGREFAPNSLTWAEPPLPLRWNKEDSHGGVPHTVAVNVGRIDVIWREDNKIMGSGVLNLAEADGQRAYDLIKGKFLKGVSIDADDIGEADIEYVWPNAGDGEEGTEVADDIISILFGTPEKTIFHAGRLRASTLCDVPAFVEAYIALDEEAQTALAASAARIASTVNLEMVPTVGPWNGEVLVAHAVGDEWRPDSEWFKDPKFTALVPVIIADSGRVYGHAAPRGACHIGFADECVTIPLEEEFPYFLTGEVVCSDGSRVQVGQITVNTGHAPLHFGAQAASGHYDNTGCAVADVAVGTDAHGIWFAGALRPDATAAQIHQLRAAGNLSPDWRQIGGRLRLVALLGVNAGGYPIPRLRARVASGVPQAMVASGLLSVHSGPTEEDLDERAMRKFKTELAQRVSAGALR